MKACKYRGVGGLGIYFSEKQQETQQKASCDLRITYTDYIYAVVSNIQNVLNIKNIKYFQLVNISFRMNIT